MDTNMFVKSLRDQIEKATGQALPWGDTNPLVVIGLTEAILDLGFTEDQMYPVIRGFLRQLAAQVHPDRSPTNVSDHRQSQILQAFNYLDDRHNFTRALDHFRTLKAEDRRENKILSQSISALRHQIQGFESHWDKLQEGKKQLEADQAAFTKMKADEKLLVPELEMAIESSRQENRRIEDLLEKERVIAARWRRQFRAIAEYFAYMNHGDTVRYPFGIQASEARWVAVASIWPYEGRVNSKVSGARLKPLYPSPLTPIGSVRPTFKRQALAVVQEKRKLSEIIAAWKLVNATVGTPDKLDTKRLPLGLSILKLDHGKPTLVVGHRWAASGGRVIGCLPPDKIPMKRSSVTQQTSEDIVFDTLHPVLVPNGLLIAVRSEKYRKAKWSMTCPAIHFSTKRIILAVG